MYCKKCPGCSGKSYSATYYGVWECPYCGNDLSKVNGSPAGADFNGEKVIFPTLPFLRIDQKALQGSKSRGKILYLRDRQS